MKPSDTTDTLQHNIALLKHRAFAANHRAKKTTGSISARFYRTKDQAINELLKLGYAYVDDDDINWYLHDPVISVQFVGGGQLHTKISCLDSRALRVVRRQLNGGLAREDRAPTSPFDVARDRVWS